MRQRYRSPFRSGPRSERESLGVVEAMRPVPIGGLRIGPKPRAQTFRHGVEMRRISAGRSVSGTAHVSFDGGRAGGVVASFRGLA